MLRFKNILAVIEHGEPLGSEIDHALKLARLNGAAITIMETCNYLPEDVLFSLEGGSGRQVMKEFEDRRRARLTEVASRWEDLDPTLLLPAGKPFPRYRAAGYGRRTRSGCQSGRSTAYGIFTTVWQRRYASDSQMPERRLAAQTGRRRKGPPHSRLCRFGRG